MAENFQTVSSKKENSAKFAVAISAGMASVLLPRSGSGYNPSPIYGAVATTVARIRYEWLRLATLRSSENFLRVKQSAPGMMRGALVLACLDLLGMVPYGRRPHLSACSVSMSLSIAPCRSALRCSSVMPVSRMLSLSTNRLRRLVFIAAFLSFLPFAPP